MIPKKGRGFINHGSGSDFSRHIKAPLARRTLKLNPKPS